MDQERLIICNTSPLINLVEIGLSDVLKILQGRSALQHFQEFRIIIQTYSMQRHRPLYALAILTVIAAGLLSRSGAASYLHPFLATYAGDTLWALTVFLVLGFSFARTPTLTLAGAAIAISFSVEFSQLYQAPWINNVRSTLPGKLLLGAGFLKSDLLCYVTGIAIGTITEILIGFRKKSNPAQNKSS